MRKVWRAVVGMVVLALSGSVFGAGAEVTDEQVVESMKKGIDFLLSKKKVDNWEYGPWPYSTDGEAGGETSLVLYALLHAGDSLQDNMEYRTKLYWRGKELGPAVEWLQKNPVKATYVAGLQASALTLLPVRKDQKPGEGSHDALESCRFYLLLGMGADGGYTYSTFNKDDAVEELRKLWEAYYKGKSAASKKALDALITSLNTTFGGPMMAIQVLVSDLRAKAKANPGDAAKIDAELKELEKYTKTIPEPKTFEQQLSEQKKALDDHLKAQKRGGASVPDPRDAKKTITKEELEARIEKYKARIQTMLEEKKKVFSPIGDLSNAQYGALAGWALAEYQIELPDAYWQVTERFWRLTQRENGAWPYIPKTDTHVEREGSMCVAGLASLFLCQEFNDTELRLVAKEDKNIDRALSWLDKNFKADTGNLYYMYGVERVGLASGLKFFGTTNWYKEGAADLVKRQKPDGSWTSEFPGSKGTNVPTAYALLFLSRGRNPVVFNKLQYNGPWNARPRDSAYVTRWMSKHFEKPINWQVVNLQVSVEEWQDAPILLITGSQDPKFTKEDVEKLRAFVQGGGMIFSTADGGSGAFTEAMRRYASTVVNKRYEMRMLPRTHDLFSKEMGVDLPNPPALLGMSNGVRELWIHSANDLGADWQQRKYANKSSFELGAALYFYSSGMSSLRSKLQPIAVKDAAAAAARTVELARVDYAGNADPEPGAWDRMAKLAREKAQVEVKISSVKISELDAAKTPVAHLTGTTKVTFTDEDAAGLKKYLDAGGLLFVDAAGGNAEFAASARELVKKACPGEVFAQLPQDHPLYVGNMPGGAKLGPVDFRKYGSMKLQRRVEAPALEGIVTGGKTKVIFSSWDVCSGFLGTNTWGVVGYGPGTAEVIGRNLLCMVAK